MSPLLVLAVALAPPPQEAPARDGAAAYREDSYRKDLHELCTEQMAGRAAGAPGGARAIAWLEGRFDGLGLRPLAGDSFLQEFEVADPSPPRIGAATRCELRLPGAAAAVEVGVAACPFPFSADGEVAVPVVFAGHGLLIAALGIDDYRGLDVRGKAVLVLRGGPRWQREEAPVRAHLPALSFRAKVALAERHGAAALLVVERSGRREGALDPARVRRATGAAGVPVCWLDRRVAARWFEGGAEGLTAAETALDGGGPPAGLLPGAAVALRVALERPPPRRTANVLGLVPGTDPACAGELVVVGAHHDHIGRGEFGSLAPPAEAGRIHPGADDNASGIAAMLALAAGHRARGGSRRTVVFAAFGAEELGQRGSRWFLEHAPAGRIVAMLELNMVGRGRSGGLTVYGAGTGEGLRARLVELTAGLTAGEAGLRARLRDRTTYRSDQSAFVAAGVPALLLTTGLHDQYHRPGDVPELVEVPAALRIVGFAGRCLAEFADGPRRAFVPAGR